VLDRIHPPLGHVEVEVRLSGPVHRVPGLLQLVGEHRRYFDELRSHVMTTERGWVLPGNESAARWRTHRGVREDAGGAGALLREFVEIGGDGVGIAVAAEVGRNVLRDDPDNVRLLGRGEWREASQSAEQGKELAHENSRKKRLNHRGAESTE